MEEIVIKRQIGRKVMAGYVFGFIWALLFAIRYTLVYQDISQATLFVGAGILIMILSWIYNEISNMKNHLGPIEEKIQDLFLAQRGENGD